MNKRILPFIFLDLRSFQTLFSIARFKLFRHFREFTPSQKLIFPGLLPFFLTL